MPTLRSGKVWQIWRFTMFLSISLPLSQNLTPSLLYHILRTRITKVTNFLPFCTIGISMYQKCILPYFVIPSTSSPQADTPFEHSGQTDRRTDFFTPCYVSSFFSPLSTRGPTRRRNSTGLAKLWGGWPIELGPRWGGAQDNESYGWISINSLTAIRVLEGTKNSRPVGFLR